MRRSFFSWRSGSASILIRFGIVVAVFAAVAVLAMLPGTRPPQVGGIGLISHALAFGALTIMIICLFGRPWLSGAAVFVFSALIEAMQALVPHRNASMLDIAANFVGVALAVAAATVVLRRWRQWRGRA